MLENQKEIFCEGCKKLTTSNLASKILLDSSCTHNYSHWHYKYNNIYKCNDCGTETGKFNSMEYYYVDMDKVDKTKRG